MNDVLNWLDEDFVENDAVILNDQIIAPAFGAFVFDCARYAQGDLTGDQITEAFALFMGTVISERERKMGQARTDALIRTIRNNA